MTAARLSWTKRVAFGVAVPLGLVALAEVAVRVADPEPPRQLLANPLERVIDPFTSRHYRPHPQLFWELQPDLDIPFARQGDRTDGLGLRNPTTPGPKAPGTTRVLCLGDSCTYGLGVRFEDAWPSRLRATTDLDVVNGGTTGYSSHQGRALVEGKLAGLDPDVVVVEYGINDLAPWPTPVGDTWAYLSDRERALHVGYVERPFGSALVGWLAGHFTVPVPDTVPTTATVDERAASKPRVSLGEFEENIRALLDVAPRSIILSWCFRPQVEALRNQASHPALSPHVGTRRMITYQQVLERIADDERVPLIDIAELFAKSPLALDEIFVDDCHVTPAGAQFVADAVAKLIGD